MKSYPDHLEKFFPSLLLSLPFCKLADDLMDRTAYQELPVDHEQEETGLEIGSAD
jgi:hypothetical protein